MDLSKLTAVPVAPADEPRFRALMDQVMPRWRAHRDTLNRGPLAHEAWTY